LEELIEDLRFNNIEARSRNAKELVALFDERFSTRPREEWLILLE
jgi:crotonobetainyl-CoA:carnitine CoA-transferase CaiB-like acyl-CoA transferase